ncbi:unnamed protein product [Closterium sp. NIES-54]
MLRTTLAALDFFPSSPDPSLFVRRGSTSFFVLVYVDDLVFATPDQSDMAFVKEELQRRHTCTDLGELQCYLGLQIPRDRAARTITLTQSHMVEQILTGFCFPFSKELCWLSFLLIGLGERPRSPQVLFTDNRSAILLWEELRLVGKAKHIQIRYFLLRELQQRGQALVRRVVSEANTAYIFTKALPPCDHERFCTKLVCGDFELHPEICLVPLQLLQQPPLPPLLLPLLQPQLLHLLMFLQSPPATAAAAVTAATAAAAAATTAAATAIATAANTATTAASATSAIAAARAATDCRCLPWRHLSYSPLTKRVA